MKRVGLEKVLTKEGCDAWRAKEFICLIPMC
jgi:hypothetical protein